MGCPILRGFQNRHMKIPSLLLRRRPAPLARRRRPLSCFALREPSASNRPMLSPRLVSLRHSGSPAVCLRGFASPSGLATRLREPAASKSHCRAAPCFPSQLGKPALSKANAKAALVFPRRTASRRRRLALAPRSPAFLISIFTQQDENQFIIYNSKFIINRAGLRGRGFCYFQKTHL